MAVVNDVAGKFMLYILRMPIYILVLLLVQATMSILIPNKYFTYAFLVRDSSKIVPRHIYSATRDPLSSIVTENVAIASTEPIMVRSSEASNLASGRAAHGERFAQCFDILISERTFWSRE